MTRPRLLDLFCGAGGAAMGYHRAGFDVVGVDNRPQPRYPFAFHQADAMTFPLDGFDAIHASPPCQAYSSTRNLPNVKEHPKLIDQTRDRLTAAHVPWVMENVVGAPLAAHIVLCGTMFGLSDGPWELRRHRIFETSGLFVLTPPCSHSRPLTMGLYGNWQGRNRSRAMSVCGHGSNGGARGWQASLALAKRLMGIDWMNGAEITQAIPPAYTEHIGAMLLDHLKGRAA